MPGLDAVLSNEGSSPRATQNEEATGKVISREDRQSHYDVDERMPDAKAPTVKRKAAATPESQMDSACSSTPPLLNVISELPVPGDPSPPESR